VKSFFFLALLLLNFLVLLHLLLLSACIGKEPVKHTSGLLQTEGIHAAFYNSTGTRIAMATTKGRLILCDQNLKILKAIQAHKGVANSSFFSLSDKHIITGGSDRKIRQWAARSLQLVHTFPYTFNSHTTVLGNQTMVGCGEYGKVLIYHRLSKKTSQIRLSKTAAYHVYYNQKDTSVVVSAGRAAYEVDILNNRVSRKYDSKQALVYCVMPDQTNTRVVLGCADSTIKIFDRNTKQLIFTSRKLDGQVYVACYNYQNNTIAASTSTGSIYFFDTKLRSLQKRIKAFNGCINTIHYHPSDAYIVAGSLDKLHGGAKLYSTKTYRLIKQLN
jgi:WD40 repeat protein